MQPRTALSWRLGTVGAVGLLLAITALAALAPPFVSAAADILNSRPPGALVGIASFLWGVLIGVLATGTAAGIRGRGRRRAAVAMAVRAGRLVLHLWPVALLTAIYPVASHRMGGHAVGGVPLTTFLLAVALVVPWVTQGACMPLYRVLGPVVGSDDRRALRRSFSEVWITTFVQALPVTLVCALPLRLALHWSPQALGAYILLTALDVLFAQALVLANLDRSRVGWALAWTAYALPIVVVPGAWYLPPVLGLLTQVLPLRRNLLTRPHWIPWRPVASDITRGLLLGSVLWADKVFYFLRSGGDFPVATVFLALLPAVVTYNYYFICLAPTFDDSVARLRDAVESRPLGTLSGCSSTVSTAVSTSVERTAMVGALLSSVTSWALAAARPELAGLVAGVCVASWLFMMITILCYKLDYIGERLPGQVFGAVHLVLCAIAFVGLPAGAVSYAALAAAEVPVFFAVLAVCRRAWRTPEYTFFWRHALDW